MACGGRTSETSETRETRETSETRCDVGEPPPQRPVRSDTALAGAQMM
jgi:hypothetical protein